MLKKRKTFIDIAPHLSNHVPIMIPAYSWFDLVYYYVGAKFYDLFAGSHLLRSSHFLTRSKSIEELPILKKEGLKGSVVYFDGKSVWFIIRST